MVTHDPELNDARPVPFRLGEQKRTEEVRDLFVDQRQARPGCPREVGVQTKRLMPRIPNGMDGSQPNERVRRPSGRVPWPSRPFRARLTDGSACQFFSRDRTREVEMGSMR